MSVFIYRLTKLLGTCCLLNYFSPILSKLKFFVVYRLVLAAGACDTQRIEEEMLTYMCKLPHCRNLGPYHIVVTKRQQQQMTVAAAVDAKLLIVVVELEVETTAGRDIPRPGSMNKLLWCRHILSSCLRPVHFRRVK